MRTALAVPAWLEDVWRHVGAALVGPLILVGATGVLVLFGYNANPDVANARLHEAPAWVHVARSLHLWSSNALLAGSALHVAWVWRERRVAGPYRHAYLLGSVLLGLLALEHLTGFVLRWDEAARRLATYERALLPVGSAAVESLQLPLHVGLLGGLTLLASLLHIGLVGGGAHARVRPPMPGGWKRLRRPLVVGSVLAVVLVGLLALLRPAPTKDASLAWPLGIFSDAAGAFGAWAFAVAALVAWLLVALQPAWAGRAWVARPTQALLALLFVASFAR